MKKQINHNIVKLISIALLIGIIGFTTWFVWQSKRQTETITDDIGLTKMAASDSSNIKLDLNNSLLPKSWGVDQNNDSLITLSNANGEELIANPCFVEILVERDSKPIV